MNNKKIENIAFIDGQNLSFGTVKCSDCSKKLSKRIEEMKKSDCICGKAWKVDYHKFRIYLKEKFDVEEAYYFLGYFIENNNELYKNLKNTGFIVMFKEHNKKSKSFKKGNVDTDIVFEIMKSLIDGDFDKIILVSGDGDYSKLVDYLISKNRFAKIFFPNMSSHSSLYKKLGNQYIVQLSDPNVKKLIMQLGK
jgi:uncharacterized LabA/DUF88 family protein